MNNKPNQTNEYPAEKPCVPCRHCKGLAFDPNDDSKHCDHCNGTGDGRYEQVGGLWFGGRGLKKATGSELRHLRRVSLRIVSIFGLVCGLFIYWLIWFFQVGIK